MKEKTMVINHETAMRLWERQFGNTQKAIDFAGREIAKAAYDRRTSKYGWNVDHILPQSRGGKTADHNLICCHMETNSEKADKFPCFKANGIRFEVRKVQNHYEIVPAESETGGTVDFYNAEDGVALWEQCLDEAEEETWCGFVMVSSEREQEALFSFVSELFKGEIVSTRLEPNALCLIVYDLNKQSDIQRVLDLCVMLNTYMKAFYEWQHIGSYEIRFDVKNFNSKRCANEHRLPQFGLGFRGYPNALFITEPVSINTNAKKDLKQRDIMGWYLYDYYFTQLREELEKF